MTLQSIRAEYERYRLLLEGALAQVGDKSLFQVLGDDENSIAIIVYHLGGNLRSRFTDFLTSDGEKPWRNRDQEFVPHGIGRDELMAHWQAGWAALASTLEHLTTEDLSKSIAIRGQPLTVLEALHRSLAHAAYHVGQIVLLCRHAAGHDWRSLSIPRGGSSAYNENPIGERAPSIHRP